jgi:BirA family biotin operon repressor/biotin-[acetyl-CoA-carboxylase] ligase
MTPKGIIGKTVHYFDTLTSTFDAINDFEFFDGLTVACSKQTQGSGRLGRVWQSDEGGVYFTFALVPPFNDFEIPFITIVCALGVCNALNRLVPCQIKWPNDIVTHGKKLCGILTRNKICDGQIQAVLVGIGINVNNSFSHDLPYATSVGIEKSKRINENLILRSVLDEIDALYSLKNSKKILDEYTKACVNLNKEVTVHYHNTEKEKSGICVSILPDGSMNVLTDDGIINVHSGEVSVKGIYGQKGTN